jgi:hypothetical protein
MSSSTTKSSNKGELRQRRNGNVNVNREDCDTNINAMDESVTDIPAVMLNGDPYQATERTQMPFRSNSNSNSNSNNSIFRLHNNYHHELNNSSSSTDLPEHDNDNDSESPSAATSTASVTLEQQIRYDDASSEGRLGGHKGGDSSLSTSAHTTSTVGLGQGQPRNNKAMAGAQVKHDEKKRTKIVVRVVFGFCMFGVFSGSVFMGHLYICLLVAAIEGLLFRELVRVRYSAYFHTIQNTIPLFRTTQWMWFATAIFYTYGDFVLEIIQRNRQLHYLLAYAQYAPQMAFLLYSGTFVVTITTLQREHIKFQINQSCWTVLVLMLTVGQLKYVRYLGCY